MLKLRLWASFALLTVGTLASSIVPPANAQGEWLYQDNCAICHGPDIVPRIPGPKNLKRSVNRLNSEQFVARIRSGELVSMTNFDYLSDEELAEIYAFIYANKDANYRYDPATVERPEEEEIPELPEPDQAPESNVVADANVSGAITRPIRNRLPLAGRSSDKSPRNKVISRRFGDAMLVCRANRSMWFEIIRPYTPRWKPRRNFIDSDNDPNTNDATWMVSVFARLEATPTATPRRGFCGWEDGDLSADAGAGREIVIRYRPMGFELPFASMTSAAGRPLPLELHGGYSYARGLPQSLHDAIFAIQHFRDDRYFRVKVRRIPGEIGPNGAPVFKSVDNDHWGEVASPQPRHGK